MRNSYAKINLYLDVLGLLPDGYHEIRTVFAEIAVHDVLKYTLTRSRNIEILTNVDAISNQDNLVVRIARYLQERYHVSEGVNIELEKNIPLAAGMGGGSSNAAVTIQALNELWNLSLSDQEKWNIASIHGNDIPYFLVGGTALGTHKGEIVEALSPIQSKHILLVKPEFGITAREAYDCVEYDSRSTDWQEFIRTGDIRFCYNRLQNGIIQKYPLIGVILEKFKERGALHAIMTGSGSTCVGFYSDQGSLESARIAFASEGYWTCSTETRESTMSISQQMRDDVFTA